IYSVRRMTEGAWIASFCEWSMRPLCSSTRATPLKIITTARLSVHTLTGSKEVLSTKTLPFILGLILRERGRQCQNNFREILIPGPGDGQHKHLPCSGLCQGRRARGNCCAGSKYVVNQQD